MTYWANNGQLDRSAGHSDFFVHRTVSPTPFNKAKRSYYNVAEILTVSLTYSGKIIYAYSNYLILNKRVYELFGFKSKMCYIVFKPRMFMEQRKELKIFDHGFDDK